MNDAQVLLMTWGIGTALGWVTLYVFSTVLQSARQLRPEPLYRLLVATVFSSALVCVAPVASLGLKQASTWFTSAPSAAVADGEATHASIVLTAERLWQPVTQSASAQVALCVLGALGLVLALVGGVRLLRSWWSLRGLLRRAQASPLWLSREVELIANELGVPMPRVLVSRELNAPAVAGSHLYTLLLPDYFLTETSEVERRLAVRHELLHIVRRDPTSAFLLEAASVPLLLHPRLARITELAARTRELAVDQRVAPLAPKQYAKLLLRVAERASIARSPELTVPMASSHIRARLTQLVSPPSYRRSAWPQLWTGLTASVALCLACGSGATARWDTLESERPVAPPEPESNEGVGPNDSSQNESTPPNRPLMEVNEARLAPEVIRRVMRSQFGRFRACYEAVDQKAAQLKLSFTIGEDGHTRDIEVDATELPQMGPCLQRATRAIVFPEPDGGIVTVVYPIVVAPG